MYRATCPGGHKLAVQLIGERFELLSEMGMSALLDGYYREAIVNFTACMERFHEFFVKTILISHQVWDPDQKTIWKMVAAQSERQFGMFVGLYSATWKAPPPVFPASMVALRNNVVHKGRIASLDEALTYGQAVLDYVGPMMRRLYREHHQHSAFVGHAKRAEEQHSADTDEAMSFTQRATLLSRYVAESHQVRDLRMEYQRRKRRQAD